MAWHDWALGPLNPITARGRGRLGKILKGTPEEHERISTLLPEQMGNFNQLQAATQGPGAGGAFGTSADYYRNLLSNENPDMQAFAAPEMRRFNEQIIPDLAHQFAGFGAGSSGLSGSSFRNAAVGAGTDLAERLGAIRAQLRQQGAQGLQGIGQSALGNFSQDVMTKPSTEGLLSQLAPAIGTAAGAYFGGPAGASVGGSFGSGFSNWLNSSTKGKSSPYGSNMQTQEVNPFSGFRR